MILLHFVFLVQLVVSSKILFVIAVPSRSHHAVLKPIYRELSLRGHSVTAMTVYPIKEPSLVNLTEIDWSRSHYLFTDVFQLERKIQEEDVSPEFLKYISECFKNVTAEQLSHPDVQNLLKDRKRKFDLIILENMAFPYYIFAERFDCPIVLAFSMPVNTYNLNSMGAPDHPVLYPDINLGFVSNLSFCQRIWCMVFSFWFDYRIRWKYISSINAITKRVTGIYHIDTYKIERERVSLLLETRIPAFHKPRALVQNIISVNGLQIHSEQPLSKVNITLHSLEKNSR